MIDEKALSDLKQKFEAASEPPWAYELTGDKDNSWGIGILVDEHANPIAGEAVEPFNEETGEYGERPIVVDAICSSEDNIPNAILITSLVNSFPELERAARLGIKAQAFLELYGTLLGDLIEDKFEGTPIGASELPSVAILGREYEELLAASIAINEEGRPS